MHGTFARKSRWCAADSPFANHLRSNVSGDITIGTFRWSGANTLGARLQAAEELRQVLSDAVRASSVEDIHVVIGHSHGGAVAAYAVAGSIELVDRVKLICLSTPFLVLDRRQLPPNISKQVIMGACLFLLFAIGSMGAFSSGEARILQLALAALSGLVAWRFRREALFRVRLFAEEKITRTDSSMLNRARSLFVRSSGDEASLVLLTMQFFTFVADRLWEKGSRATPRTTIQVGVIVFLLLLLGGALATAFFSSQWVLGILLIIAFAGLSGIVGLFSTVPLLMQCATGIAPVQMASGRTKTVQFRRACPKFLRQTFHEWAQHSMKSCRWARAYYDYLRAGGKQHHAAIRALAFKWQRILFRCWKDQAPYDESKYLAALKKRNSHLLAWLPA